MPKNNYQANTTQTPQSILNNSYDPTFDVIVVEQVKRNAGGTAIEFFTPATEETLQAVLAASGGTTYNYVKMDEGATYTYIGYTNTTGWQIKRMTNADTSLLYADGLFSGTYADFDAAWAARASITYAYTT